MKPPAPILRMTLDCIIAGFSAGLLAALLLAGLTLLLTAAA